MASISLRKYIRWLPNDASEPTSTLVVTSPGRHFVDIRANRPDNAPQAWPADEEKITPGQLDWAIAGKSSYWKVSQDSPCTRGRWEHWIDSQTSETDGLADEGDNYDQPDGTTLEKGRMLNPATGKDTDYEELWESLEPVPVNSPELRCAVLQLDQGKTLRGSVVIAGQFCQGMLRNGDSISLERWQHDQQNGWRRLISMGDGALPCKDIVDASELVLGQTISTEGNVWKIIEASGY